MDRQAILERLGWTFIRIRGSEYYRNRAKTIDRVIGELTAVGIKPESMTMEGNTVTVEDPIVESVKRRAG